MSQELFCNLSSSWEPFFSLNEETPAPTLTVRSLQRQCYRSERCYISQYTPVMQLKSLNTLNWIHKRCLSADSSSPAPSVRPWMFSDPRKRSVSSLILYRCCKNELKKITYNNKSAVFFGGQIFRNHSTYAFQDLVSGLGRLWGSIQKPLRCLMHEIVAQL